MTGDNEGHFRYRYVTDCRKCGASVSARSTNATRLDGEWVRCMTDGCGRIVWATERAEDRPPRFDDGDGPAIDQDQDHGQESSQEAVSP